MFGKLSILTKQHINIICYWVVWLSGDVDNHKFFQEFILLYFEARIEDYFTLTLNLEYCTINYK